MHFLSLFAVTIYAGAGYTQTIAEDVANIPTCAIGCLYPAIAAAGCGKTDWTCTCGPGKATVKANAFTCIVSSCSTSDALKTQQLAQDICALNANSSGSTNTTPSSIASSPSMSNSTSSTLSSFSTSSTSTIVLTTNVPPSGSSTSTTSPQPTLNPGLSREAIVGIAVGAVLGGLFFIVLLALFWLGCRKRRPGLKHLAAMAVMEEKHPPTKGSYELDGISHMNELASNAEVDNTGDEEIGKAIGGPESVEGSGPRPNGG